MSDDTQIAKTGNNLPQPGQTQQPIQTNLNQYGNDSTQIAYVQHYDATTNQTVLIMQGAQPAGGTVVGQGVTFNYDCFNFFVLGTEQYDGPTFMVPKNRALTESTSDEPHSLQRRLRSLRLFQRCFVVRIIISQKPIPTTWPITVM